MAGWDVGEINSLNLRVPELGQFDKAHAAADREAGHSEPDVKSVSASWAEDKFRQFFRTFRETDSAPFKYREELKLNFTQGQFFLVVDLTDLYHWKNEERIEDRTGILLHNLMMERPVEYMPLMENAATQVARAAAGASELGDSLASDSNNSGSLNEIDPTFHFRHQTIQVQLIQRRKNAEKLNRIENKNEKYNSNSEDEEFTIRSLSSQHVSKVVTFRGIVVSAGRPRVKPTLLAIRCRSCGVVKTMRAAHGFGGTKLPRRCDTQARPGETKCQLDPYEIEPDSTQYIDQQRLKLQELTEQVSTGELPRHVSLACERYLVGTVKPGARVSVTGVYTTYEANTSNSGSGGNDGGGVNEKGIRIPYVRAFGLIHEADLTDNQQSSVFNGDLSMLGMTEDVSDLLQLSLQPNIYEMIANSMCPAIFDNEDTYNIKQSLAVQLFGGCSKSLSDGMRLRGDINMLLLGDPSVAKSQFLKFVSGVAPIGVYTSGKGSSAAGLTASVVRDPGSGEFHLEGGALVLADGGLVCIDEFDKMREQDRVAIHEAMEQQTISIAKAGITTILNSRTSVLAAANPIFGRYDDMKSPTENIDFQTSILSRFDLIFIVRDIQDETRDSNLAKHVLNVHRFKQAAIDAMVNTGKPMIEIPLLKRYIAYARQHCHPRLSEAAAQRLKNQYVSIRQQVKVSGEMKVIPITVRQLEAIIRLSEALARMQLNPVATEQHVEEAIRLFQCSTLRAATQGSGANNDTMIGGGVFDAQVREAERQIKQRVMPGATLGTEDLKAFLEQKGISRMAATQALEHLTQRQEFAYARMRRFIKRVA